MDFPISESCEMVLDLLVVFRVLSRLWGSVLNFALLICSSREGPEVPSPAAWKSSYKRRSDKSPASVGKRAEIRRQSAARRKSGVNRQSDRVPASGGSQVEVRRWSRRSLVARELKFLFFPSLSSGGPMEVWVVVEEESSGKRTQETNS
ncbi:hypothetical protein M5K25_005825 [Dendrobium thyrsiflorum]|uniref:Uncharacterized protein n=1 Tax=Dendrobium thyrsiflorum TaxID=117978 RepID=A0ABD0VIV6_DENTH